MISLLGKTTIVIPTKDHNFRKIEEYLSNNNNNKKDPYIEEIEKEEGFTLLDRKILYNRFEEYLENSFNRVIRDDFDELELDQKEKGPLHKKYNLIFEDDENEEIVGKVSFKIYPKYLGV